MPNTPNPVQKIQDLVTNQPLSTDDLVGVEGLGVDGNGHSSLSPIGFPNVNFSGSNPATKATPNFKSTYKDPKTYPGSPGFSESGEIQPAQTHPYRYDGSENDNKANHVRNSYSDIEVASFLRRSSDLQLKMGLINGTLHNWMMGTGLINIGGYSHHESIFVHTLGLNLLTNEHIDQEYVISEEDSDITIDENGESDYVIDENV